MLSAIFIIIEESILQVRTIGRNFMLIKYLVFMIIFNFLILLLDRQCLLIDFILNIVAIEY